MKDQKVQRWEVGIVFCVAVFMSATETNWWWIPLLAGLFLGFIGFVVKMEDKSNSNSPKPMATPAKGHPGYRRCSSKYR